MSDNINNSVYKNFNITIGISFILLISIIYITFVFNISAFPLNSDLEHLWSIIASNFIYYIKIFFSFLIPLSFFIFSFLFVLNPIDIKSLLISFVLISLIAFYLYTLPYDLLIKVGENLHSIFNLIVKIILANLLMLFVIGMSYVKYDIKKFRYLYDFYTMIAEIIIWSLLIFFIIFIIVFSIAVVMYLNEKIEYRRIIIYLIRNDMKNLRIFLSIFIVLKISVIYFSYVMYNKMSNTKLSISISRTISLIISAFSIAIMIFSLKYNLLNSQYIKFIFLFYLSFIIFFMIDIFLFRIDREYKRIEYIIYVISNISGAVFSIFLLYICFNKFFYYYIIIFYIVVILNFIYNILISILKKYIKFIFLYNYIYIILFIILLFIDFI